MNVQTELMRTLVAVKWLRKAFLAMAPQLILYLNVRSISCRSKEDYRHANVRADEDFFYF